MKIKELGAKFNKIRNLQMCMLSDFRRLSVRIVDRFIPSNPIRATGMALSVSPQNKNRIFGIKDLRTEVR
jgi:hypothetical protein